MCFATNQKVLGFIGYNHTFDTHVYLHALDTVIPNIINSENIEAKDIHLYSDFATCHTANFTEL